MHRRLAGILSPRGGPLGAPASRQLLRFRPDLLQDLDPDQLVGRILFGLGGKMSDGVKKTQKSPKAVGMAERHKCIAPEEDTGYDVFLCYHSADKPAVKAIGQRLANRGLKVWLDEWAVRPGFSWLQQFEEQIEEVGAAAVFVGSEVGPWQKLEIQSFLRQFVDRRCPVIPVFLEDCPEPPPKLPAFLNDLARVDFRQDDPEPFQHLFWGITGIRTPPGPSIPEIRLPAVALKVKPSRHGDLREHGAETGNPLVRLEEFDPPSPLISKLAMEEQMEYLDFLLHLDRDETGFIVCVDSDDNGRGAVKNPIVFDHTALPDKLKAIEQCLVRMHHPKSCDFDRWRRQLESDLESLGGELFRILSEGEVGQSFHRIMSQLEGDEGKGLRIRIASDPADGQLHPMTAAAWELIHDARRKGFLGQRRRFPISRYFTGLGAIKELSLQGSLRVLLVESQPKGFSVRAAKEKAAIRLALATLEGVEVIESRAVVTEIRDIILARRIHILHFIGHGGFNDEVGEGWVVFANEDNSPARWPGDLLADRLKDLPTLRLVVLSNCYGAAIPRGTEQDAFWTVAPALLRAKVPAVIAMQFPISNDAALAFSRRFYERLVAFDPIDVAANEARMAMADLGQSPQTRLQWAFPAVFMRVGDGRVIARPEPLTSKNSVHLKDTVVTARKPSKLRIGIRTFATGFGEAMEKRVDRFLALENLFDVRWIRDPGLWESDITFSLREFLERYHTERSELEFDFAAVWSVAFASGWLLEAKSGLEISVVQRRLGGRDVYFSQQGDCPEGKLWQLDDYEIGTGTDLAVAISITHHTLVDVEEYLHNKASPPIGRLLHASVAEPGPASVKSGVHALRLAQQLARTLSLRSVPERRGTLHLFSAAPNAFSFFLGQLAHAFGATILYEYAFRQKDGFGDYRPSITFPPA